MVKAVFFAVFIVFTMVYPLFVGGYKKQAVTLKTRELPSVSFIDGSFKLFNPVLEKKGSFKKLDVFKDIYEAEDLKAEDLIKNEFYSVEKAVFKNRVVKGFKVEYKNRDISLKTDYAVYDRETKILDGGEFEIFSDKIRGYGKAFEIDDKKNLYAQNITYFIKVKK